MLNDILCTFCHHETVLELYGNGQGDQMILLAPSAGQNPVFIERIEADNLGKKCFFLFYSNKFRLRVRVFETCCLYINLSIEDNNYHNINEIHTFLTFSKHFDIVFTKITTTLVFLKKKELLYMLIWCQMS